MEQSHRKLASSLEENHMWQVLQKKTRSGKGKKRWDRKRRAEMKIKGEENISERAEKRWQRGDVLGGVESGLIWYDGPVSSSHTLCSHSTVRCTPVWWMWSNVVLISRHAHVKRGDWRKALLCVCEAETTIYLNQIDGLKPLNSLREAVEVNVCMHICNRRPAEHHMCPEMEQSSKSTKQPLWTKLSIFNVATGMKIVGGFKKQLEENAWIHLSLKYSMSPDRATNCTLMASLDSIGINRRGSSDYKCY